MEIQKNIINLFNQPLFCYFLSRIICFNKRCDVNGQKWNEEYVEELNKNDCVERS